MAKMSLFDRILDERNIYAAIYSIESYIFDKGLLDTTHSVMSNSDTLQKERVLAKNDLDLFYRLSDKYNIPFIKEVVAICKSRLKEVLTDPEDLFEIQVYFKLKSYDGGKLLFRPLHTARLTDMICMVCILNVLMFEDDLEEGNRSLSDLSKLIPNNFYGNIPSTNVLYLFHKWQNKYKEYSENVIKHCRSYQQSHTYLTEVCLDIKNFFPSVSPEWLFRYIVKKTHISNSEDIDTLRKAISKLLYFKIDTANVKEWIKQYYPDESALEEKKFYMNCGIPQGLPQSYFFGNLCMIEIKRILMKEKYFKGDAYFYVDDSVIYVHTQYKTGEFNNILQELNKDLKDLFSDKKKTINEINVKPFVAEQYLDFQNQLNYCIQFHEEGKSVCTPIDKADRQYGIIADLSAETSMSSRILWSLDELDDSISLSKLEALKDIISNEISELSKKEETPKVTSRLKLLRRFKRYFLYREKILTLRENGGDVKKMQKEFNARFVNYEDVSTWFKLTDADIFSSEYRMLIQQGMNDDAESLCKTITNLEKKLIEDVHVTDVINSNFLYYTKDAKAAVLMKNLHQDEYGYLKQWAQENYRGLKGLDSSMRLDKFNDFIIKGEIGNKAMYVQDEMIQFIKSASQEYNRKIVNAFYSELMSIEPSDSLIFTRSNARKINYAELRILAYLRNRDFNLSDFISFFNTIDIKDVSNQMAIDMGLLSALSIFITYVKKPSRVDSLIMTHRITKGLWYNGSKFLHSYTLHNEEHAVTLINKSIELTNRIDYFSLKDVDFYILFLSCYLHDISMVIHPDLSSLSSMKNLACYEFISEQMRLMMETMKNYNKMEMDDSGDARIKEAANFLVSIFNGVYNYFENDVRSTHAKSSAAFILDKEKTLFSYLEPTILSFVAKVSESHGADVYDIYGLKSQAKDDVVSLKYLMLLIRLADLQDVANDRVNYYLLRQNMQNLSLTSRFHWISHLVTDKIELKTEYAVAERGEDGKLPEHPIEETINLNLYLNFKQQTALDFNNHCRGCQCVYGQNSIQIEIKGEEKPIYHCNENCTVLCYWMMKKHEYLIHELVALQDYLNSVNNSLIHSRIYLNINFKDEMKLDPDMFAHVQEYLEIV